MENTTFFDYPKHVGHPVDSKFYRAEFHMGRSFKVTVFDYRGDNRVNYTFTLTKTVSRGQAAIMIEWENHYFDKSNYALVPIAAPCLDDVFSYSEYDAKMTVNALRAAGIGDEALSYLVRETCRVTG